jgi:hypothetical protein
MVFPECYYDDLTKTFFKSTSPLILYTVVYVTYKKTKKSFKIPTISKNTITGYTLLGCGLYFGRPLYILLGTLTHQTNLHLSKPQFFRPTR